MKRLQLSMVLHSKALALAHQYASSSLISPVSFQHCRLHVILESNFCYLNFHLELNI
jgi:hypothetical protein